tara:strand:- start:1303 stop:1497 length:195 start_codon:yes stop_codon:yes gene_type:complete
MKKKEVSPFMFSSSFFFMAEKLIINLLFTLFYKNIDIKLRGKNEYKDNYYFNNSMFFKKFPLFG